MNNRARLERRSRGWGTNSLVNGGADWFDERTARVFFHNVGNDIVNSLALFPANLEN
jgi:hypothetical protein